MTCVATTTIVLAFQHEKLLEAARAIEALAADPTPVALAELAALRWTFTRTMLLHFAHVQTHVLDPLMRDRRPDVAERAARSSADLASVYDQFARHAQRWKDMPPALHWPGYREAIALLMRRLRVRIASQGMELYHMLPAQPGGGEPAHRPHVDYCTQAWKVRLRPDDGGVRPTAAAAEPAAARRTSG